MVPVPLSVKTIFGLIIVYDFGLMSWCHYYINTYMNIGGSTGTQHFVFLIS